MTLVQTAKHGDLLSILPILHHEFKTTGVKPTLVVSKAYAEIPLSLDYINTLIFDGDQQDLAGAIKFAKTNCDDVRIPQLHGKGFEFKHRHPSFQYDQWDRAGALDMWGQLPLALPRGDTIIADTQKVIVFADHSQSSPFPFKEDMAKLLTEHFPQHQIVRLSALRFPRLSDALTLLDAADLIVSVDTVFLHLSAACRTPVIAMVTDKPSRWHGSAWHPRYALHCRYHDFPRRTEEIVRVARNAIAGKPALETTDLPMNSINGYNTSIIRHGENILHAFRYHPVKSWKTRICIHENKVCYDVRFPSEIAEYSTEDCRIFHHNGKLMMTYVVAKEDTDFFKCVVGYGMLVQREGQWHIERHIQPIFRNNDFTGLQKNWCPFEYDGAIHFIWGNHMGQQIVIRVDGDKVVFEHKSPEPKWDYGEIRGGAIVPYKDKLLRFFHSRTGQSLSGQHGSFQYHVGASLLENKPPFKTLAVSKWPILSGDERYVPGVFHFKPNCALVFGAIADGEAFNISVGRNDCRSEIVRLEYADLNLD